MDSISCSSNPGERQSNKAGKIICAMFSFVSQRPVLRRLIGFLAIFAVIVAAAWQGLDMGEAPVPTQSSAPVLESSIPPLPEASAPSTSAPANGVTTVTYCAHISELFAAGTARVRTSVVNGNRQNRVEFLTKSGAASDVVYSESALSREGWKLSIASNGLMATLSNDQEIHEIPVIDSSPRQVSAPQQVSDSGQASDSRQASHSRQANNAKQAKQAVNPKRLSRLSAASARNMESRMPPLGDHEGAFYPHLRL